MNDIKELRRLTKNLRERVRYYEKRGYSVADEVKQAIREGDDIATLDYYTSFFRDYIEKPLSFAEATVQKLGEIIESVSSFAKTGAPTTFYDAIKSWYEDGKKLGAEIFADVITNMINDGYDLERDIWYAVAVDSSEYQNWSTKAYYWLERAEYEDAMRNMPVDDWQPTDADIDAMFDAYGGGEYDE